MFDCSFGSPVKLLKAALFFAFQHSKEYQMNRPRNLLSAIIYLTLSFFTLGFLLFFITCRKENASLTGKRGDSLNLSEWSANQSIYEVNLRQYSVEGTFKAFEKHLPRLKKMGIGILWFMPIQPIGFLEKCTVRIG